MTEIPQPASSRGVVEYPDDPGRMARSLRALRGLIQSFTVLADWRSRWQLLGAKLAARKGTAPETIAVRIRGPGRLELHMRPGSSDIGLLFEHFALGAHLPPHRADVAAVGQICELGTSSGLALADLARRFPNATLLGVEPDPENFALARRNLEPFADRCELIKAAVWDTDTDLVLGGEETGLLATTVPSGGETGATTVRGITVDRLLREHMPGEIDYLHVDAAGAETRILTPKAIWLDRVRSLTVHIYPDRGLDAEQCTALLRDHGFATTANVHWWGGQVLGVR